MTVVCADDHQIMLSGLMTSVQEALPDARIYGTTESEDALAFIRDHGCDVLLCEVEMYTAKGTLLAEEVREIDPRVNIIFVTVCDEKEHAREVLRLRPSGYLTKPATKKQISDELAHLRYPISP